MTVGAAVVIDTALIMAAGLGSRIPDFSRHAPKGFIPVADQAIVERSINILIDRGIRRIVIGTGYKAEKYQALSRRIENVQIECVHNPDYENSGSLETFLLCAEKIQCDFLSLESDLLYDARMIDRVLACPFANVMLASEKTDSGDEVYIQANDNSKLVRLSKDKLSLARIDAELVGICKISQSVPVAIKNWMASAKHLRPAQIHYEEGLAEIAEMAPMHVEKTCLPWTEIDTPEHLARANSLIWPRIAAFL